MNVVTDLNITGRPAQFGRGVMTDVGNKLLGQFADKLAAQLATSPDVAADEQAAAEKQEPTVAGTAAGVAEEVAASVEQVPGDNAAAETVRKAGTAAKKTAAAAYGLGDHAGDPEEGRREEGRPGEEGDCRGARPDGAADEERRGCQRGRRLDHPAGRRRPEPSAGGHHRAPVPPVDGCAGAQHAVRRGLAAEAGRARADRPARGRRRRRAHPAGAARRRGRRVRCCSSRWWCAAAVAAAPDREPPRTAAPVGYDESQCTAAAATSAGFFLSEWSPGTA